MLPATTFRSIYVFFMALFFVSFAYSQPSFYPPESADRLQCDNHLDANCSLGSSLSSIKDAVGLLYMEINASPKYSDFMGTVSLVRVAGNDFGNVLLSVGHASRPPRDRTWIRYEY